MKKLTKSILVCGIIGLTSGWATAQTQQRGEVTDQEFVIRKDRVLTVPKQPRMYSKLPVLPKPSGLSNFNYLVSSYELDLKPIVLKTEAAQKLYQLDRLDLYNGYVRAGYGNYESPLLEARYMETEVAEYNYSVQLNHQSFGKGPVLAKESKESHTNLGVDGSYFLDQLEVFGGIHWKQDSYQFYGIDPSKPALAVFISNIPGNSQQSIGLRAGLRDIEKVGPLSYEGQISFRSFSDSYAAKESQVGLEGLGKYRANEDWLAALAVSYFGGKSEDVDYEKNRTYFAVRPAVSYNYGIFDFTAGVNLIAENDSIEGKSSDFHVFPVLKATFQFADEFGFFGELSGDVKRNTYFDFVNENPYLGPSDQILNTVQNYKLEGGIEGQFEEAFHYRAAINVSRYNHLQFFENNYEDELANMNSARFNVVYDDKSTVYNINAALGYKFSDMYQLNARLDLNQYQLKTLAEAWHKPVWELSVNNQVMPLERLLVQANLNFMGGIKAKGQSLQNDVSGQSSYQVMNLKSIADLQLKADYGITERISVFAEGNNILNGKNTRWLNYPVRGIQFIGGAALKF